MNIWGLRKQEGIQTVTSLFSKKHPTNKLLFFSNAFGIVMCHSTVIYQTRSLLEHKIILKPENPGSIGLGLNSCWQKLVF